MVDLKSYVRKVFSRENLKGTVGDVKRFFTKNITPPNTRINIIPISPQGGALAGARAIPKAISGVKTLFARATGNPLAGGGIKAFLSRVGGRALGFGAALEAGNLAYSGASGTPYMPLTTAGRLKTIAGLAINPISGFIGASLGYGKKASDVILDRFTNQPLPFVNYTPNIPFPNVPQFDTSPNINFQFPDSGTLPNFGMPTGTFAPSFSVDAGVQRGGIPPELLALLIALLGVGGAAAFIRRKRRKKKYKKRRE